MYGRENLLMETAMCIMNVFCSMCDSGDLDFDPYDPFDDEEALNRMRLFTQWAREFEDTYSGSEEYEENYMLLINWFATEKLIKEYMED